MLGGVSDETVNRWARDGKLPCITLPSGTRRFRPEVIGAILAGRSPEEVATLAEQLAAAA